MANESELEAWRLVGEQLWEFVRPWGLCGAHPRALEALENLSKLLGKSPQHAIDENVKLLARQETIAEVKQHFEEEWFRKMRRADAEAYLKSLE